MLGGSITRSSQADLLARIDRLGTNLLTVVNGHTIGGDEAQLPAAAGATVARTGGVVAVAPTTELSAVPVYRSDRIPAYRSGGLDTRAADPNLLSTLDGHLIHGVFLNAATARYPVTVLGYSAARSLGIADLSGRPRIWLGHRWFSIVGILAPLELAPEIDRSVLIGFPVAARDFGYDGHPTRIYVRAETDRTGDVSVSRPSDTLTARLAVAGSGIALFLGLGAVALLVGGIGIANTMVISVLERRTEIGLRRALGVARRHLAAQFLVESLLLGTVGGATGILAGAAVIYGLAYERGWQPLIPPVAVWVGLVAAAGIGALAGLYPALRAARLAPTDALRAA